MAKKAEDNYFPCVITRPIYSSKKHLEELNIGDRFYIEGEQNDLFSKTNKYIADKIICVNELGIIHEFDKNIEVVFVHGVKSSFYKISSFIVEDVKENGYLLYRTDLYPD